jgi:CheY-like chemotaxis protein
MVTMSARMPLVLYAEDEESDAIFLRRAFGKAEIANPLVVVKDGQAALDYLTGRAPYDNRDEHPLPALILLDLKMPRLSGFDVLKEIGARPELGAIPAVVLSSSSSDEDVCIARELGARDYLVKPHDFAEYVKIVRGLGAQWLSASAAERG